MGRPLYFAAVVTFFFFLFSSPILSGRKLDVYRTSTHDVCGLSANLECRSEMCCIRIAENTGRKKSPKNRHLRNIAQFCQVVFSQRRHISTIEKNLLNRNISSTCPHNIANFGTHTAEIGSGVRGTPANFNGFRVLASLLQRRRSPQANQTLHDVCPSSELVHYIYIFGGTCPWWNFVADSLCTRKRNFCVNMLNLVMLFVDSL